MKLAYKVNQVNQFKLVNSVNNLSTACAELGPALPQLVNYYLTMFYMYLKHYFIGAELKSENVIVPFRGFSSNT